MESHDFRCLYVKLRETSAGSKGQFRNLNIDELRGDGPRRSKNKRKRNLGGQGMQRLLGLRE